MKNSNSPMAMVQQQFGARIWDIAETIAGIINDLEAAPGNRLLVTFNEFLEASDFTTDGTVSETEVFKKLKVKLWGASCTKIEKDRARSFHRS